MRKSWNSLKEILVLVTPFWVRILGLSFLVLLISLVNQISPQINKSLIDLIGTGHAQFIVWKDVPLFSLLIVFLVYRLVSTLLNRFSEYGSSILADQIKYHLREKAFSHILELSVGYFSRNQSGKIMNKISRGSQGIQMIISNVGIYFLPSVITAIISVIIVASISPLLALGSISAFVPFFYLRLKRFKSLEKIEKKSQKFRDKDYSRYWEAVANIRLVKAFRAEGFELRKFRKIIQKAIRFTFQEERINNRWVVADLLMDAWLWALYAYIFYMGVTGHFTIGVVVLLVQYVEMIRQPMWNLNWVFWQVNFALIGVRDYLKVLHDPIDVAQAQDPVYLDHVRGKVEFKNVHFKYPEKSGQEVFKGISFVINPGQTLALVGKSGAGKTTIAHLLARFYDLDQGSIFVDDIDIRQLSFDTLRKATGLVMQDSFLFDDTIANNLRYGKSSATDEELIAACTTANAMEFIEKFPKKLNTVVGERGVKLSGGQKQRLSIARTVLMNPQILILDEATSSLDSHSEMLVQDALNKLIKGRTTIIIAHRLSTVQKADQIIVLDDKKILEQGTHRELLTKDGLYSSLYKIQSGKKLELKDWDLVS